MKKIILLSILFICTNTLYSQFLIVYTPTLIPNNPSANDNIKIVTRVKMASAGAKISGAVNYNFSQNIINVVNCYFDGMSPTGTYINDTIVVGQIPIGSYTINIKLYDSPNYTNCATKIDSAALNLNILVNSSTGLIMYSQLNPIKIYPNPANEILNIDCGTLASTGSATDLKLEIINSLGQVVYQSTIISPQSKINIEQLSKGIYIVQIESKTKIVGRSKLIKQ